MTTKKKKTHKKKFTQINSSLPFATKIPYNHSAMHYTTFRKIPIIHFNYTTLGWQIYSDVKI